MNSSVPIKVLVPSMHQYLYHLLIRVFLWALRCLPRHQHVIQILLSLPSMRAYRPYRTVPWYPLNIMSHPTVPLQKRTVTCSTQPWHRFPQAHPTLWSANQILAWSWAQLLVIRRMGFKGTRTLPHTRSRHIQCKLVESLFSMYTFDLKGYLRYYQLARLIYNRHRYSETFSWDSGE